jgi:hypothetical protein
VRVAQSFLDRSLLLREKEATEGLSKGRSAKCQARPVSRDNQAVRLKASHGVMHCHFVYAQNLRHINASRRASDWLWSCIKAQGVLDVCFQVLHDGLGKQTAEGIRNN